MRSGLILNHFVFQTGRSITERAKNPLFFYLLCYNYTNVYYDTKTIISSNRNLRGDIMNPKLNYIMESTKGVSHAQLSFAESIRRVASL